MQQEKDCGAAASLSLCQHRCSLAATLRSCSSDFPTVLVCVRELWAERSPLSLSCLVRCSVTAVMKGANGLPSSDVPLISSVLSETSMGCYPPSEFGEWNMPIQFSAWCLVIAKNKKSFASMLELSSENLRTSWKGNLEKISETVLLHHGQRRKEPCVILAGVWWW